ncbi:hypothetical protein [Rhizobacter sp. OV335]|uniref:phage adaptor protein n=1 Tax=Rhizobacter sp. OV335 TaxID=1500264 RepID=UPI00091148CB|nr:hypothetical protein [Rhizobacter sp. OV335]SHN40047.1 hypothetical protein SAMN02787076_06158 [Rhizobacter sp. OV335]
MAYRTLGALRAEVLARLGMAGMGASGGANQVLINSFLRNGQAILYRLQDWKHMTDYFDKTTGVSQNLYDYPVAGVMDPSIGCARDKRVLRIETNISGEYRGIKEGITTGMWSTMDMQGNPERFERFKQILVYPKADAAYTLRIWFVADLHRFTEEADEATLDDDMILLHATAMAKAHYRQPDAQLYQGQLDTLLGSLRGQSFNTGGVYRRAEPDTYERRPAVAGRDAP